MIFRLGKSEDIAFLKEAICRIPTLKEEDVLSYLESSYRRLYVLQEENHPLAFATITLEGTEAELDDIAILPKAEGKGLANCLLNNIFEDLKQAGISTLFLEVRRSNTRAIRLYEKNGFVSYRERKNYYLSPVEDAICYRKELFS